MIVVLLSIMRMVRVKTLPIFGNHIVEHALINKIPKENCLTLGLYPVYQFLLKSFQSSVLLISFNLTGNYDE